MLVSANKSNIIYYKIPIFDFRNVHMLLCNFPNSVSEKNYGVALTFVCMYKVMYVMRFIFTLLCLIQANHALFKFNKCLSRASFRILFSSNDSFSPLDGSFNFVS